MRLDRRRRLDLRATHVVRTVARTVARTIARTVRAADRTAQFLNLLLIHDLMQNSGQ